MSDTSSSVVVLPKIYSDDMVNDNTIRITISNLSKLGEGVLHSQPRKIGVHKWRIVVKTKEITKNDKNGLGFFLECCSEEKDFLAAAYTNYRLVSQQQGKEDYLRNTLHEYVPRERDWGWSCFMKWKDILDESRGFIKNDEVILEVSVEPREIEERPDFTLIDGPVDLDSDLESICNCPDDNCPNRYCDSSDQYCDSSDEDSEDWEIIDEEEKENLKKAMEAI